MQIINDNREEIIKCINDIFKKSTKCIAIKSWTKILKVYELKQKKYKKQQQNRNRFKMEHTK